MKNYSLLITTNSYAGNFERELGHYITGYPCEYGMYKKEISARLSEEGIDDDWTESLSLKFVDHEHGCDPYLMRASQELQIYFDWEEQNLGDKKFKSLLQKLKDRTMAAPKFLASLQYMPKDLQILKVELIIETVSQEIIVL